MANPSFEEVRSVQDAMIARSASYLLEEAEDLRGLIRITIEFFYFLTGDLATDNSSVNYMIETIFSGVDGFMMVSRAHRFMPNRTGSAVTWGRVTHATLKQEFVSHYQNFRSETNFEKQCRLLLDLFRLQLIFAGMDYD